ncbi:MAG TPA: OmpA family protein [Bdellovibrionota bacterium]|nr:OmpA family protein [Bdellovibrionota bacterium]
MIRTLITTVLAAGLCACGVSKEKYTALEDQVNDCQGQLSATASAKKSCEDRLASLSTTKLELEEKTKTYEDLMSSLKDEINSGKVKISEMEGRLTVNMIDKILFSSGSAQIQDEGRAALKKVADVLKGVKDKRIVVEGHTDNVQLGPSLQKRFPTNWELSTARATSVVKFLTGAGVPATNMAAAGFSEFSPVASNLTPEGKQQNRRIEIVLTPKLRDRDVAKTKPATTEPPAKETPSAASVTE